MLHTYTVWHLVTGMPSGKYEDHPKQLPCVVQSINDEAERALRLLRLLADVS